MRRRGSPASDAGRGIAGMSDPYPGTKELMFSIKGDLSILGRGRGRINTIKNRRRTRAGDSTERSWGTQ